MVHQVPGFIKKKLNDLVRPQARNERGIKTQLREHLVRVSPKSGERSTSVGLSESLIGLPTVRYLPRAG